jgi:hypothetical protein
MILPSCQTPLITAKQLDRELESISSAFSHLERIGRGETPSQETIEEIFLKINQVLKSYEEKGTIDPQEISKLSLALAQAMQGLEKSIANTDGQHAEQLKDLRERMDHVRTIVERIEGTFLQSDNPDDIDWKVLKYEAVLRSLKQEFEKIPTSNVTALEESFCLVSENSQAELVPLIKILKGFEIYSTVNRFNQEYLGRLRTILDQFLVELRFLVSNPKASDSILDVCKYLFLQVKLENECFQLIKKMDKLGRAHRPQQKESFFPHSLIEIYENLNAVPYAAKAPLHHQIANSARGTYNFDFDPFRQGNPIHLIYQIKSPLKSIYAVGMGNPTNEAWGQEAQINPEFLGLLKSMTKSNKRFLLVSNQNYQSGNQFLGWLLGGDETSRIKATVLKLPQQFPGTFYTIALSKNSDFYHQAGNYKDIHSAPSFIQFLQDEILKAPFSQSGNCISPCVREAIPQLDKIVRDLIQSIYAIVFDKKPALCQSQRKAFIVIFYTYMVKILLVQLSIDAFTICCKDGIDRGAESNAELYALTTIVQGKEEAELEQQRMASLMFSRAMFVRKRPPFKERVERLVETVSFCMQNKRKLQSLSEAWGLGNLDVLGP